MEQDIRDVIREAIRESFTEIRNDNDIRDRGIKREFQNVYEIMDSRFQGINREFQNVHEIMYSRFAAVDSRLDKVESRLDAIELRLEKVELRLNVVESRLDALYITFFNSRVIHLAQRILPLPVFDNSHKRLPIPKCFPKTAFRLYRLQDRKNWWKLQQLLIYYRLETETIRLVYHSDLQSLDSDSDSDSDSEPQYTADSLQKAIEANPFRATSTLGAHLGLDCDALHDRVQQLEFQQNIGKKNVKRTAERSDSGKRILRRMLAEGVVAPLYAEGRLSDGENSEERRTELHWEANNSSEFRRATAHLRFRDACHAFSPGKNEQKRPQTDREQRELQVQLRHTRASDQPSPTEKMTSSSEGRV